MKCFSHSFNFQHSGITYSSKGPYANNNFNNQVPHHDDSNHAPVIIQPTYKKQDKQYNMNAKNDENDSMYATEKKLDGPKVMALVAEPNGKAEEGVGKKKLVYKSLSGIRLKRPVRLQMWLDIDKETFGSRTNPQCVHWSTLRG